MSVEIKFKDLISVIVPVYNTEKYLERCVHSIADQTYPNLEIILIDDGSKDLSGDICDQLAAQDSRIKVIHKQNGGQSSARNAGLKICSGDFIGFVDSDDWIHPEMYAYLLSMIRKENAEGAQIGYRNVKSYPAEFSDEGAGAEKTYSEKEILNQFMRETTVTGSYSLCRCLFLNQVLSGLTFRDGKINEDIDFKYMVLDRCHHFCVSPRKMYYYFQSTGSTTTDGLKKKDFDLYDAADELYLLTQKEKYGDIRFLGEVKKARTAFSLLCRIAYYGVKDPNLDEKQIVRKLTKEHRGNVRILLKAPLSASRKILTILLAIHINLVKIPIRMARKLGVLR